MSRPSAGCFGAPDRACPPPRRRGRFFDEFEIPGLDGDTDDTDDNGLGAEGGVRWMVADPFEIQGYVRYTAVGDVDTESDDEFDDDVLSGVGARYFFFDNRLGVQAGYELGEINTWNVASRWQF